MQANIESIGALERRVDLTVPSAEVDKEVTARLAKLARTVKMPGFRPGKVPMKMVAATYGAQVQAEVLSDKVGAAFNQAVSDSKLRVAGAPRLEPKTGSGDAGLAFSATFEVYPEVELSDPSKLQVERAVCEVTEAEIDKTLEIMRRQRAGYEEVGRPAADQDRVVVDFRGMLDGVAFDGGTAADFPFVLGQGRMLPDFEAAVRGLAAGQQKTFDVNFPADYPAPNLAGKKASFDLTVKRVEQPVLPPLDAEFAKGLGIADGDVTRMRAEVRANLEREVKGRLKSRTKDSAMKALMSLASFELPKALVAADAERLMQMARKDMASRGMVKDMELPADLFTAQAERRVRLGLLVGELVRRENLQAQQPQVRKAIEEIAQSYERPADVIQWYLGDKERLADVETMVVEDNVVGWVLSKAAVNDVPVAFDELMGRTEAA